MTAPPSKSAIAEVFRRLEQAVRDDRTHERAMRASRGAMADAISALLRAGVASVKIAARVAAARAEVLDVSAKQRLAARLRKRASRAAHAVTPCPENLALPSSPEAEPMTSSSAKEGPMAQKLVKRTVVEEFIEDDKKPSFNAAANEDAEDSEEEEGELEYAADEDDDAEAEDDDEEEPEEVAPAKATRRRSVTRRSVK